MTENKIDVSSVFDNECYTVDRYTIQLEDDQGNHWLVATSPMPSHPLGVWSVIENDGFINPEDITEEDKHIGIEIEWSDLPESVKQTVVNYFELDKEYYLNFL